MSSIQFAQNVVEIDGHEFNSLVEFPSTYSITGNIQRRINAYGNLTEKVFWDSQIEIKKVFTGIEFQIDIFQDRIRI